MSDAKPLYLQIYDDLKILIKNQTYQAGDLLPTETELCKTYETSRPTIAKAVKLLSDEHLVYRKAGFGTQVLAEDKPAATIALLIPQLHETEIFMPICQSIAEAAASEGMNIIRRSEFDPNHDVQAFAESLTEQFIDLKVNGVFFTPVEFIPQPRDFNLKIIERLTDHGISVVLLDRDVHDWPSQTPYDLVGIDNIEAGFVVTEHLIGNGCRDLAFISESDPAMTVHLRRIGVREAMIQNGLRARDLVNIHLDPKHPEKAAAEILSTETTGIVCANDTTAATLLRALLDLGADIPGALQVCGFDDVKYASLLSVPLTSYRQPCNDIGKIAINTMIARIKYPDAPAQRITLKGELVVRESASGPLRSADAG
ncbi:MAG: GntR family transcriptional regulator [Luteolibacter sp.]